MSGYGVARRLRAQPGLRTGLIVALSGNPGNEAPACAAGIDRHLMKPVDVGALRRALG